MPPKYVGARRHRRKRQRKSRTEDFSDSSPSDSDTGDQVEEQDMEERDAAEPEEDETMLDAGSSSGDDDESGAQHEDAAASMLMPNARTTMNLLPELEKANEEDMRNYFRSFVTSDFREELKKIEEDVNDQAEYLRILGDAVTAGVNIFDEKEKIQLTMTYRTERSQR
ncbi:hypothetical protein V1515DRAFT_621332 [Lipomyces mesembrius]